EPGVADPRPPQNSENQQAADEPVPVWIVRHQLRALGNRQHEHEVEEELERRNLLAAAHCGCQPRAGAGFHERTLRARSMTARAWRRAARSEISPPFSSTTKASPRGKRWFCQRTAVPG